MESSDQIVNRVSNSTLVTLDLEQLHQPGRRVIIDLKDQLYAGLIIREQDFRTFIKTHDWSQYEHAFVAVTCSTDAIIPTWAYMLVSMALQPFARVIHIGTLDDLESALFAKALEHVDWDQYINAKVVVKGCSKVRVPTSAYVEAMRQLTTRAASIMYGEPCSTVPLFKKKKPL